MAKVNVTRVVVFMAIAMCIVTYTYNFVWKIQSETGPQRTELGRNANFQGVDSRADISNIFVPDGQKYNVMDGTIYNCFSTGPYQNVTPPKDVRDFAVDAELDKALMDADTRQAKMSKNFGKPELNKTKGFQTSGFGSTLKAAQPPLALLNSLIDRLKIYLGKSVITMVDIPCGDFFWMRELVGRRPDLQYTGFDIVPAIIGRHNKDYKNMSNAQFRNVDIVKTGLDQSFDIIFSRDMLQHLSNADALKVLKHFSASGSKLLVTTNLFSESNLDLGNGGRYRHLNLMLPPINLVPPICSMQDRISNKLKDLSVWKLPLKQHE